MKDTQATPSAAPAPGELTTKQMLESVQAAKRALESIEAAKPPTKADGYLGHIVV
jgi:hypothetical protein